jgi:hypothetical protein
LLCLAWAATLLLAGVARTDDRQAEDPDAPTPAEEELLRQVIDAYAAQLKATRTIEFRYTLTYSDGRRECDYARDGEKYRHRHIHIGREGTVAMPHDVSWDGGRAYYRMSVDRLGVSRESDYFRKAAALPDEELNTYPAQAYGWESSRGAQYAFRSAREVEFDGLDCIELKFDIFGRRRNETLIIRHAREYGYWPVHVWRARPGALPAYEMVAMRFGRSIEDGMAAYYPLHVESCSFNRRGNSRSVFVVNEATLRINQPIEPSRFRIPIFTWDAVWDFDTGQRTEPKAPTAVPDARVGFPFAVMLESAARAQPS